MSFLLRMKSLLLPVLLLLLAPIRPGFSAEIKLSVCPKGVLIDEGDAGTSLMPFPVLHLKAAEAGKETSIKPVFVPGADHLSGTATYSGGSTEGKLSVQVSPKDHTIAFSFDQLPAEAKRLFSVGIQFDAGQFRGGKYSLGGDKLETIPLDFLTGTHASTGQLELVGRDGVGLRIKGPSAWQTWQDDRKWGNAQTYSWSYGVNLDYKAAHPGITLTVEPLNIPSAALPPVAFKSGPPGGGKWEPIPELSDEFKGPSLDTAKWTDSYGPSWLGRQPSWFCKSSVQVKDGKLQLVAHVEEPAEELKAKGYHTFALGCAINKTPVLYGYFEIKAKPMAVGICNAFWFTNAGGLTEDQTSVSEIDVFEICGGPGKFERTLFDTMHHWKSPGDDKHWAKSVAWRAPAPLYADYHVYGIDWEKDEIKCYFDGYLYARYPNTAWHIPLHLLFDNEVAPSWFGIPDTKGLPSPFSIEYVRAWRRVDNVPTPAATPSA